MKKRNILLISMSCLFLMVGCDKKDNNSSSYDNDVTTSNENSSDDLLLDDSEEVVLNFPLTQINSYMGLEDTIPEFTASSYNVIYSLDSDNYPMVEIYCTLSSEACASAYKTILEAISIEVYDDYFSSYGFYIAFSQNELYQLQFGDDEVSNEFYLDIFIASDQDSDSESENVVYGTSASFPESLMQEYLGTEGSIPSFEATEYNYYFETYDGELIASIYAVTSDTACVSVYSSTCSEANFTVDTSYVEDYDITVAYNNEYWIQYYEIDGYFKVDVYLYN